MGPIEEQTILVTGATSGLGQALAQALAKHGATLLLHGRDPERGLETVRKIKEATGNERIKFCRANLSSLREVEDLARQVISEVTRLDVLVNNAGIGFQGSHCAPGDLRAQPLHHRQSSSGAHRGVGGRRAIAQEFLFWKEEASLRVWQWEA